MSEQSNNQHKTKPGIFKVIASILAAGFGVQSSKNRERDFKQGKRSHYIIGGIVFTLIFIITLLIVVNTILAKAGM
jgi:hypothetical protein